MLFRSTIQPIGPMRMRFVCMAAPVQKIDGEGIRLSFGRKWCSTVKP